MSTRDCEPQHHLNLSSILLLNISKVRVFPLASYSQTPLTYIIFLGKDTVFYTHIMNVLGFRPI